MAMHREHDFLIRCRSQDAKSKLREIAEKRAEDVEEVMLHLEKTLACLGNRVTAVTDSGRMLR